MANSLPAPRANSDLTRGERKALQLIADGMPVERLAVKIAKGDMRKVARIKRRLFKLVALDESTQAEIGLAAKGALIAGTPDVAQALVRRAKGGRPDAIKLAFEASGFHNPKMQHEHSGEIKITLQGTPRPEAVVDGEADVIED